MHSGGISHNLIDQTAPHEPGAKYTDPDWVILGSTVLEKGIDNDHLHTTNKTTNSSIFAPVDGKWQTLVRLGLAQTNALCSQALDQRINWNRDSHKRFDLSEHSVAD
jgi:hypothetical protein